MNNILLSILSALSVLLIILILWLISKVQEFFGEYQRWKNDYYRDKDLLMIKEKFPKNLFRWWLDFTTKK